MTQIELVCDDCLKRFMRSKHEHKRQLKNGKIRFFCSRKCAMKKCGEEKSAPFIAKNCKFCNQSFQTKNVNYKTVVCCSLKCSQNLGKERETKKWKDYIAPKRKDVLKSNVPDGWIKGCSFNPHQETIRREKIRTSIEKRYKNGWMPKAGRCNKIKYTSSMCGNVVLDGTWELEVAKFLDKANVDWIRNKIRFEYDDNGKKRHYTPDFYIKDKNAYLEVKGYETELDRTKWKQFKSTLFIFKKKEIDLIRKCEFPRWEVCLLNKMTA